MPDGCFLIAMSTRRIGEIAISLDDRPLLFQIIKFFNTFLRITINALDVRTAFNVMFQYRLLTEHLMQQNNRRDEYWVDIVIRILTYMRYYSIVRFYFQ